MENAQPTPTHRTRQRQKTVTTAPDWNKIVTVWCQHLSTTDIANALQISTGLLSKYKAALKAAGVNLPVRKKYQQPDPIALNKLVQNLTQQPETPPHQ